MRAGLVALALILGACLLAPVYASLVSGTDPFRTHVLDLVQGQAVLAEAPGGLGTVPIGPGWRASYALGADALGRDVAARLLYGGRTSLLLAGGATLLCLVLGGLAGVACSLGGWTDTVVGGLVDLVWAFPVMLLAISLSIVMAGEKTGIVLPMLILGLVYTPYVARPVRAALQALARADFIEAAHATGGSSFHVLRRHMLPQLLPLLRGLAPIVTAMILLTEAALSVLGIGVTPPGVSWGTLIADGVGLLHQRPMVAVAPGLALSGMVLALNAVGEGLGAAD